MKKIFAIVSAVFAGLLGLVAQAGAAWSGSSLVDGAQVDALSTDAQSGFQMLIATLLDFAPYIILIAFGFMGLKMIDKRIGGR